MNAIFVKITKFNFLYLIREPVSRMLSIITISFSDIEGLTKTIKSVQNQDGYAAIGREFEHIVVASGLNKLDLDFVYSMFGDTGVHFVFNQDSGLYNAMNLGALSAIGTHVLYLNGGDEFFDKTSLKTIIGNLFKDEISLFRVSQYFEKSCFVRPGINSNGKRRLYSHQGFVAPLNKLTPKYNEMYQINADSYWMRECMGLFVSREYSEVIAKFELGGISNRPCLRTILMRLYTEGKVSAAIEATKFIIYKTMGARAYYKLASMRAGYDHGPTK